MFSGRISPRRKISQIGKVYDCNDNFVVDCFVRDLSATGARLQLRQDVTLPNAFTLVLTEDGGVRRRYDKVWQFSIVAGVRFAGKLETTEQSP
jgi:hypothetical protein